MNIGGGRSRRRINREKVVHRNVNREPDNLERTIVNEEPGEDFFDEYEL